MSSKGVVLRCDGVPGVWVSRRKTLTLSAVEICKLETATR